MTDDHPATFAHQMSHAMLGATRGHAQPCWSLTCTDRGQVLGVCTGI